MSFRIAFFALCLVAACLPMLARSSEKRATTFSEWPNKWEGRSIAELPLSDAERKFNDSFPGEIAKFTDGRRELILRRVNQGTRRLHSSTDCFRGLGYSVTPASATMDANGACWSCSNARRGQERLLIRERITDEQGHEWTDVSAWFWSVTLGRTRGPWLAVTIVESTR